ncbi:hypothetical protein QBC43DRAFT_317330 [Cladorrhinum sp. PSN259]|nr:hypothetical protein QBC43DRAFT_317330 [Cladorrhinum sp. PSN259]
MHLTFAQGNNFFQLMLARSHKMVVSQNQPQPGYPKLAAVMSSEKDIAILHRFDQSNMLSLLSLQSEIMELEKDLRLEIGVDASQGLAYAVNFKLSRDKGSMQYEKIKELRKTLKEYNELVIQAYQLNAIHSPKPSQLSALKNWLRDFNGGNSFLKQQEALTWMDPDESAYVCLNPARRENDLFIEFVSHKLLRLWHYLVGQRIGTGQVVDEATAHTSYSTARVAKAGSIIATILASLFPVLTILALNQVQNTDTRVGMSAGFTAVFAIMIVIISDARRIEVFAATATFAAVEVVFIGTAVNSNSKGQGAGGQFMNATVIG